MNLNYAIFRSEPVMTINDLAQIKLILINLLELEQKVKEMEEQDNL